MTDFLPIAFAWHVVQLEREIADGCVYAAHWTASATDGMYNASCYSSIGLERPESELIPFSQLNEELCVEWVKNKFGAEEVAQIKAALQTQIDEQRAPSKAQGLPWHDISNDASTASTGAVRARNELGQFVGDDPATPDVNEAWVPAQ